MTPDNVVRLMESSNSGDEWNANCDKVKAMFDGDYPDFWFAVVIASGVARRTMAKWGGSDRIMVSYE